MQSESETEPGCGWFRTAAGVILIVLMVALKIGGGTLPRPEQTAAAATESTKHLAPSTHDGVQSGGRAEAGAARD